jgi:hypothetical protein
VLFAVLRDPGPRTVTAGAATLALAFFALPTQIHERYAFFALPFLLLAAAIDMRLLAPYLLLVAAATVNIVGAIPGFSRELTVIIRASFLPQAVAWLSLALLVALIGYTLTPRRAEARALE